MVITSRYFDGCPNWQLAEARLRSALQRVGRDGFRIERERVDTPEDAKQVGFFRGSPTVLIDGEDPFADPASPTGLSCRRYQTEAGPDGAPSVAQLEAVLNR